jgi:hypothetical protein
MPRQPSPGSPSVKPSAGHKRRNRDEPADSRLEPSLPSVSRLASLPTRLMWVRAHETYFYPTLASTFSCDALSIKTVAFVESSLGDSRCLVMFEKPLESQPIVLVWYAALIC